MKIVIIADSHDNLANLEILLNFCQKEGITNIIHCGDVCQKETLNFLLEKFSGDIFLSLGNGDYELEQSGKSISHKRLHLFESQGEAVIEGLFLGFIHYHDLALGMAGKNKYQFVFFGHEHRPSLQTVNKTILANPGESAGMFTEPSFAVLDVKTKKIELKLLHSLINNGLVK